MEPKRKAQGAYEVGYGRPPVQTRFRRGASGNPGGRPRGRTHGRVEALILKEAYRPVSIKEGGKVIRLPALQVVLRSQVATAVKGSGPAQRDIIQRVQGIEQEHAASSAPNNACETATRAPSNRDIANPAMQPAFPPAMDGRPN